MGNSITVTEHYVLSMLVDSLPDHAKNIVERQFELYDIMQREVDGRALIFFVCKKVIGNPVSVPLLSGSKLEDYPLISGTFSIKGEPKKLHAKLHVVHGRVFCLKLSFSIKHLREIQYIQLIKIKEVWRSNLPIHC